MPCDGWNKVAEQVNFNLEIDWNRFPNWVNTEAKVLDFGCGYARVCKKLDRCGYHDVVGFDPSYAMISRGKKMYPDLLLVQSRGVCLPFSNHSFDAVVICAVLATIPAAKERKCVANEVSRVLKPGGIVHLSEFSASEEKEFVSSFGIQMRYSKPSHLRDLFSGFLCVYDEVVTARTLGGVCESNYRAFLKKPSLMESPRPIF